MADQKDLEIEEGGKGNKKLLIIGIAVAAVLAAGAAWFFMSGGEDEAQSATLADEPQDTQAANADGKVSIGSAIYVAMPRPFVFNAPGASRDRMVQIKAVLLVRGDKNEETCKQHIPLIEGTLLKTFSGTNADDLGTPEGKDSLRSKALRDMKTALGTVASPDTVEQLLFTGFVMQ